MGSPSSAAGEPNLVKMKNGWYATNDCRSFDPEEFAKVLKRGDAVHPTIGPFKTKEHAQNAYDQLHPDDGRET
jgi:hypothetical protein